MRVCVCVQQTEEPLWMDQCVVFLSLQTGRLSAPSGENGAPVGVITWRCVQSHVDVCPGASAAGLNKDTVNPITCSLSGPSLTPTFQVTRGNQSDYTSKTEFFSTEIDWAGQGGSQHVSTDSLEHLYSVQTSVKRQCLFFPFIIVWMDNISEQVFTFIQNTQVLNKHKHVSHMMYDGDESHLFSYMWPKNKACRITLTLPEVW